MSVPKTIEDLPVRRRALDPTKSFIVQAPAGSGKTELLTQRYLVLLSRAEKAPEEIIAITFTRKAAAEMRARIIHALTVATEKEPDKSDYKYTTWSLAKTVLKKDSALQWNLLRNPNRLRILTIDALSALICKQTPMLTQFGTSPSVCENAKPLYQLAAQRLLTDVLPDKKWQSYAEHLLLHLDNDVEKLEKLLTHLLDHRDQWLSHIMYAYTNHYALREIINHSLHSIIEEKMLMAVQTVPSHLKQTLLLLAHHVGNHFQENKSEDSLTHCKDFSFEKNPDVSHFKAWSAFANLWLTQEGLLRKTVDKRNGFLPKDPNKSLMLAILTELDAYPAFKNALRDIQTSPPTHYTDAQWETVTALTQLLPLLAAQLTLIFQEKEQVDFIELNSAALKALGSDESPTDLALYLDYQIHHLLIDEFQDTSIMHLHLLEKIMAGWQPNDGRTLFLVGDPMQSIYRFRNAEVGLFLRAQQRGIAHIPLEPLTLTMNFRSQKNLVDWFNHTFHTIFPVVSDIPTGRVPYTPAIAAPGEINEYHAQFYPIIDGTDDDEAEKIAEKIQDIREKNPTDSIALLVRSRSSLIPIIQTLKKYQLPFQAIDIEPLADRPEIQDLLSLTRALLHRADRIAWLAILRAPFCGLALKDLEIIATAAEKITIWEVILSSDTLSKLSQDALPRIQYLRYYLQHAFDKQTQLSLSAWIEGTWIALGGPACLTHETELDYVRAYFDLLSTMESDTNPFSIEPLTERCKKLFANTKTKANNPIQILTIHKSKGLEFDHVFIPGLHRQPPANKPKLLHWLERVNTSGGDDFILAPIKSITYQSDPMYDYLKTVEKEKQDYEITRLLYVAATRAKKSLHLFAMINKNSQTEANKSSVSIPAGSFLQKLFPIYESESSQWQSLQKNNPEKNDSREPLAITRLTNEWFSDVTNATQKSEPIYINIDLYSQTSRIIGTVIHEILQQGTEHNEVNHKSRLLSLGILPHEINDAIHSVNTAITKMNADPKAQWILSNKHRESKNEWALSYLHDNEIQRVIIDRSFIDENNTRWIIDYKTSTPKEQEAINDFLQDQKQEYESQLEKYAGIIAQTENRPIQLGLYFPLCGAWIEWAYKGNRSGLVV